MEHHQRVLSALLSLVFFTTTFILFADMHKTSVACYRELTKKEVDNSTVFNALCPPYCAAGNLMLGGADLYCSWTPDDYAVWIPSRPFCGCSGSDACFIGVRYAPYPALAFLIVLLIVREFFKFACMIGLLCDDLIDAVSEELDSACILPVLLLHPEFVRQHFGKRPTDLRLRTCSRYSTVICQFLPACILVILWFNVFGWTATVQGGTFGCFLELARLAWTTGLSKPSAIWKNPRLCAADAEDAKNAKGAEDAKESKKQIQRTDSEDHTADLSQPVYVPIPE